MLNGFTITLVCAVIFIPLGYAGDKDKRLEQRSYSPSQGILYPNNVYFGDTHVHTNLSIDANGVGNKTLGPDEAYRFAKGETVLASNGMKAQLQRPLDFIVIADHAENLGLFSDLLSSQNDLLSTSKGKDLYSQYINLDQTLRQDWLLKLYLSSGFSINDVEQPVVTDQSYKRSVWHRVMAKADTYNDPGKFTAFIGYEWSSFGPTSVSWANGNVGNLHRVVLFKDGADKANQTVPFSAFDSTEPEDLWSYLEAYERVTGGDVLAIPHNGNVSRGAMFSLTDSDGRTLTKQYAKTRSRWEPLYEVTQIKGDSEAHPVLSPTDEFADFETWNGWPGTGEDVGQADRKPFEYARSAFKNGLGEQARLGANPFKFGLIGSTDSHTSLATADENNFWGKSAVAEPEYQRINNSYGRGSTRKTPWSSSGYAAVWATENTRQALFSAMKKKEVYATTGPRMTVRFFGGWHYDREDAFHPDLARVGYEGGVPMGGDLINPPKGISPSFLIRAVRDPEGANLDRIQVIKGWRDLQGELHEKIYHVALSDDRKPNKEGKVAPIKPSVDIANASYKNIVGDPELAVVWMDPDFNREELAFYYVRVLEIPTPRWPAYDAKFFNLKDIPEDVPMVIQERAYTSPIWYSPSKQ